LGLVEDAEVSVGSSATSVCDALKGRFVVEPVNLPLARVLTGNDP